MAAYEPEQVAHALRELDKKPEIRPAKHDGYPKRLAALAVFFDLRLPHLSPQTEVVLRKATSVFYPGTRRDVSLRAVSRANPAFILYALGVPGERIIGASRYCTGDADIFMEDLRNLWDRNVPQLLPPRDWKITAQALSIYLPEQRRKEFFELRRMADWLYSERSATTELVKEGILSA